MARKRKFVDQAAATFYIEQSELSGHETLAVVERIQGSKIIQDKAIVTAPKPEYTPEPVLKDFEDVQTLLGNKEDIQRLANSDEVIQQYIQTPGGQGRKKGVGQYATTVSKI